MLKQAKQEILSIWHCDKPFLFMCVLAGINAYVCGFVVGAVTAL